MADAPLPNLDSLFVRFGGLVLPAEPSEVDANRNLQALDPACHVLAELFRSAINSEFGAVFQQVTKFLDPAHFLFGALPVTDVLELPPSAELMEQRSAGWPLLAIHRTPEAQYDEYTLYNDRRTQQWQLHYILGPADVEDERRFWGIFAGIGGLVASVIREGGHRSFEQGQLQFFDTKQAVLPDGSLDPDTVIPGAGLTWIHLKSTEGPGQAKFAGSSDTAPMYLAYTMNLETWEVGKDDLDGYASFQGGTFEVGVGGSEGTIPLIYADSDSLLTETFVHDQEVRDGRL